jgi:hypothetical protein
MATRLARCLQQPLKATQQRALCVRARAINPARAAANTERAAEVPVGRRLLVAGTSAAGFVSASQPAQAGLFGGGDIEAPKDVAKAPASANVTPSGLAWVELTAGEAKTDSNTPAAADKARVSSLPAERQVHQPGGWLSPLG